MCYDMTQRYILSQSRMRWSSSKRVKAPRSLLGKIAPQRMSDEVLILRSSKVCKGCLCCHIYSSCKNLPCVDDPVLSKCFQSNSSICPQPKPSGRFQLQLSDVSRELGNGSASIPGQWLHWAPGRKAATGNRTSSGNTAIPK